MTHFHFMRYKSLVAGGSGKAIIFLGKKKMRIESAVMSFLALTLSLFPAWSIDMRPEDETVALSRGIMGRCIQ